MIIIEVRPRLQACHVYVKNKTVHQVDIEEGDMKLHLDHATYTTVHIPGVEIKPNSLSNFTQLDQSSGTYFRIQIDKCSIVPCAVNLFDYSSKNTKYLPSIGVNEASFLLCRCCRSHIVTSWLRFARILPLPSDTWDVSDWFCCNHEHDEEKGKEGDKEKEEIVKKAGSAKEENLGNKGNSSAKENQIKKDGNEIKEKEQSPKNNTGKVGDNTRRERKNTKDKEDHNPTFNIEPKPFDLLYGSYCFILNKAIGLINVNIGANIVQCQVCLAWLGTTQRSSYTLWNSSVEFSKSEHVNRKLTNDANEINKDNDMNRKETTDICKQNNKIDDGKQKEIDKNSKDNVELAQNKTCKKSTDKNHDNLGQKPDTTPIKLKQEISNNSSKCTGDGNTMVEKQEDIALSDFINVVKENIGLNCKLLIQCQVTNDSEHSLLLWIMDRNLNLFVRTEQEQWCAKTEKYKAAAGDCKEDKVGRMLNAMKVLYSYTKNKPEESYDKDFSLVRINVSKHMLLAGLKHMNVQSKNIPLPYRLISNMNVSYIVIK